MRVGPRGTGQCAGPEHRGTARRRRRAANGPEERSDGANALGLRALLARDDVELDLLALLQLT
ncbi:MAG TPA: hypothetical protein VES42_04775, partial [Pilimelia sp.]|nr:hypothetical protein [Pilimelia sp.]